MPRQLVLPSLVSGVIWGIAQVAWFQANISLGFAIAFPIIGSLPGIIGLLIGFCFLGEVRTRRSRILALLGLILRVPGVLLIALSGLWGLGINMPSCLEPNMLEYCWIDIHRYHRCHRYINGAIRYWMAIWMPFGCHLDFFTAARHPVEHSSPWMFRWIASPVFFVSTYQSWRELGTEPMTTCTTCNNEMQRNNEHAKLCLRFGLFPLLILAKHFSFLSFPVFAGRRTFAEFSLWLARLFRTPDLVDSLDI